MANCHPSFLRLISIDSGVIPVLGLILSVAYAAGCSGFLAGASVTGR
jgi:hypothetical protein